MPRSVKHNSLPDLRAARIAQTEAVVVAAARDLFIKQGYVATTLTQVARRAGVAPRTVYVRFGTKATLFLRVVDIALVGDAKPVRVSERPGAVTAMTAPTLAERINALAEASVALSERTGPLFEVAAQAEGLEPAIAAAAQAGRDETARLGREFWRRAVADGLVPAAADIDRLGTVTDLLTCADTVVHLRRTGAWSATAHRELIGRTLQSLAASSP